MATTAKLHQFHQEFYDAKKKHEEKEKCNHTAAELFISISNSYLPLPSHISQSGHLTGAFGGTSSTGFAELSGDSPERNSGLIAYCFELGRAVKPEDDPARQASADKSIRENETGFIIMVEKQKICEIYVVAELRHFIISWKGATVDYDEESGEVGKIVDVTVACGLKHAKVLGLASLPVGV